MTGRLALTVLVCAFALRDPAKADTFAALPFFNLSNNSNLDWIGESLAESVRDSLGYAGKWTLGRGDRVEAYQRLSIKPHAILTKASVIMIAGTMGAGEVVFGEFEARPAANGQTVTKGALRITARLLDLTRSAEAPDFTESGTLGDLALLQRHLGYQIVHYVLGSAAPAEAEFNNSHPAIRLDAIESYVRGLLATSVEEKHRLFTQAARIDQAYSQPCFQLGRLHFQKKEYKLAAEWFGKVASSDAHFREAGFLSGLCLYHLGDYAGAQNAFQTVAAVVPLNEVFNNIGAAQSRRNLPEALDNFKKAMEGDSSDPDYQFNAGYALWRRSDFEAAAERFRAVLERNPTDAEATDMLDRCEKRNGPRPGNTRTERLERLKTNYEESAWWQLKAALQPEKP